MMLIQGEPQAEEQKPRVRSIEDGVTASYTQRLYGWFNFEDCAMAKGYCLLAVGRGAFLMSNIYLSASFVYLASVDAGCIDEDGEVINDCAKKVYGMTPTAVVSNIAVVSGLLSAFFMPLAGAMIDFTPHRRRVGRIVTMLMMLIQAIQIGTVSRTWLFPMAILQGINGFLFYAHLLSGYAYLPDVARIVGEKTMPKFSSSFFGSLFASSLLFLMMIAIIAMFADLTDVQTGQLGQAVNVVWSGLPFWLGWQTMPSMPAASVVLLPTGRKSLLVQSFVQVWQTTKRIHRDYRHGLRWFLLGVVFAESASAALLAIAVVFLSNKLGMAASAIGIFFVIALVGCILGTRLSKCINGRMSPPSSWRLSMMAIIVVTSIGALFLTEETKNISFVWGFFLGLSLGTYYPTETFMFSMLLPKGQEAELSGFYVYSTQILSWLPPLVFSGIVNAGFDQKYGLLGIQLFYMIAIIIISFMSPWDECVQEVQDVSPESRTSVTTDAVIDHVNEIVEGKVNALEVEC